MIKAVRVLVNFQCRQTLVACEAPGYGMILVRFEGNDFISPGFREGDWRQSQKFDTIETPIME